MKVFGGTVNEKSIAVVLVAAFLIFLAINSEGTPGQPPHCLMGGETIGVVDNVEISYTHGYNGTLIWMRRESTSTTSAGPYNCDDWGETNAKKIKLFNWVNDAHYDELLKLLKDNPPCACYT